MGRLRQREKVIARREALRNGYVQRRQILTPEEQRKLDAQDHVWLEDFSPEERVKFENERAALWSQIPEHLRDKAEKLASGK